MTDEQIEKEIQTLYESATRLNEELIEMGVRIEEQRAFLEAAKETLLSIAPDDLRTKFEQAFLRRQEALYVRLEERLGPERAARLDRRKLGDW